MSPAPAPGAPKYATPRTPARPSMGKAVAAVAQYMGTPFMPWQKRVAEVATELDPCNPGAWAYPLVIVSVPRQAGKTALLRAIMAHRMLCYPGHKIAMTAQTGRDARKRWKQLVEALNVEKLGDVFITRNSQGSENLTYFNGSTVEPFAPTPKSIHGDSLHLVTIDEAWAFNEEQGTALETAVNPTQLTVLDSQLWIVSTKGTLDSAYLAKMIRKGRENVENIDSGVAYFEWSADEATANADPFSEETLQFHPAIGYTQSYHKILAQAGEDVNAWKRSYLNLETVVRSDVVDLATWDSLARSTPLTALPPRSEISVCIDVDPARAGASIIAAWVDSEGTVQLDAIEITPGAESAKTWLKHVDISEFANIVMDGSVENYSILNELPPQTVQRIKIVKTKNYATACQDFITRVKDGTLEHDGNQNYRTALESAVLAPMAGSEAFSTRKSSASISSIRAAALAGFYAVQPAQSLIIAM